MSADFSGFRVLIDDPAMVPELGFQAYATSLSDIVRNSSPEFAVGIFGTWGSGKTTLMRQIERLLTADRSVVTAWFTAWRYEKEPHLIVPLVDVLREALDQRAATEPVPGPARRAAGMLRKAGRAFLAGLTLSAQVPGLEVQLDPGEVMRELRDDQDEGTAALSFYHAAFLLLRDAIQEFSESGTRRVVIFVDDLDRCLPANALDVLESMKLFFDVQGCVFVVGLDQAVAERAVTQKYAVGERLGAEPQPVSGVDYLKKIFQVPFALPRVGSDQLREYCWAMLRSGHLPPDQITDFNENVAPHLDYLSGQDSVNPREIKRLLNAYVLQVKMLSLRLGGSLNPRVVLALQVMSFRPDWRDFYEELASDPLVFQRTLREATDPSQPQDQVWLSGQSFTLPTQLINYLSGPAADVLVDPQLASYVSAVESSRSTDPLLLDLQSALNRLRVKCEDLASGSSTSQVSDLPAEVGRVSDLALRRTDQPRLAQAVHALQSGVKSLSSASSETPESRDQRLNEVRRQISDVEAEVRELRRQSNLGAAISLSSVQFAAAAVERGLSSNSITRGESFHSRMPACRNVTSWAGSDDQNAALVRDSAYGAVANSTTFPPPPTQDSAPDFRLSSRRGVLLKGT